MGRYTNRLANVIRLDRSDYHGLFEMVAIYGVPVMATCSHGYVKATISEIRQGAFNLAHLRDVLDSTVPISYSRNVAETRRLLALRL